MLLVTTFCAFSCRITASDEDGAADILAESLPDVQRLPRHAQLVLARQSLKECASAVPLPETPAENGNNLAVNVTPTGKVTSKEPVLSNFLDAGIANSNECCHLSDRGHPVWEVTPLVAESVVGYRAV